MELRPLTREDIKIEDWEFEFQQRSEQPILLCDWWCRAITKHFADGIGIDIPPYDYIFTDSSKGYSKPNQKNNILDLIRKKIEDPEELKEVLRKSIEIPKGFNKVADELTAAIKNQQISNSELADYWQKMDEYFITVVPWFWYPYYISGENMLTDRVKSGLVQYHTKIKEVVDVDEALLLLVFPLKKTGFQIEQERMYKLALIAEGNSNFAADSNFKILAKEYLKDFDWLTTFILSPLLPMTYEQLVQRVKEALTAGIVKTFPIQQGQNKKNQKLAASLIEIFKDDKKLLKDIDNARELGYVLTAGIEEAYIASSRYLPFLQMVADRIGVQYEDTKYLLPAEIISSLRTNTKIAPEILNERHEGFISATIGGQQYFTFGKKGHELSDWVDTELNKVDSSIKELKGQVACKGLARAKVRVANTPDEAHLLQEGEILVCPMTNPDYVPAMKRSSAIVTDEGGLLSHAAIMSREFNKPCVIGTKIATKLLKTGDMVEVDANNGVVKVISNA